MTAVEWSTIDPSLLNVVVPPTILHPPSRRNRTSKRLCDIEGCLAPHAGKGLCARHYARLKRHGDPLVETVIVGDTMRRFWSKVDSNGPIPKGSPELEACAMWLGTLRSPQSRSPGYGMFVHNRRTVLAHRLAYELERGPIPEGMTLDHMCHNTDEECPGGGLCLHRRCVRPSHLEVVTLVENINRIKDRRTVCRYGHPYDGAGYERRNSNGVRVCTVCHPLSFPGRLRGECSNGHLVAGANAYITSAGVTVCRECKRERSREWARKNAARKRALTTGDALNG